MIRAFFRFLRMEGMIDADPTELVETPRIPDSLPDVLSVEEINATTASIDYEQSEAARNYAIIETLYGSGLRVSELTDLRIPHINFSERYMTVQGKGCKQRLVPMSDLSVSLIEEYLPQRNSLKNKERKRRHTFPQPARRQDDACHGLLRGEPSCRGRRDTEEGKSSHSAAFVRHASS